MRTTFRSRSSRARQVPDPGEIDIVGCSNPRIEGEDFVVDVEIRADVADSAIVAVYSPNAQLKGQKVIGPLSVGTQTHTIRFNGAATDLTPLPPGSVPVGISVTWNLFGASPPPTADQACGYAPIDGDNGGNGGDNGGNGENGGGGNGGNGTNGGNGGNGGGGGGGGSLPLTTPQIVVAFVVVGAAMWYISNQ